MVKKGGCAFLKRDRAPDKFQEPQQENGESEVSLAYTERLCLKENKTNPRVCTSLILYIGKHNSRVMCCFQLKGKGIWRPCLAVGNSIFFNVAKNPFLFLSVSWC